MSTRDHPDSSGRYLGYVGIALGTKGLMASAGAVAVGALFALIFGLVFGLPVADLQLDWEHAETAGVVTANSPGNLKINSQPTVDVAYRYAVEDTVHEGEVSLMDDHPLAALSQDDRVTVEYLPSRPGVSRLEGSRRKIAGWAGTFGLFFLPLGLCSGAGSAALLIGGLVMVRIARRR